MVIDFASLQTRGRDGDVVMALRHSVAIEVKRAKGKGRGVFARRLIRQGEVIERVPVLLLATAEVKEPEK